MVTLYDAYGREVDLGALHEEQAGPTITGVRQVVSGHPAEGLTPTRLGAILREAEEGDPTAYLEIAEDMEEKDLHYRSVLATRKNQVAGLDIAVDAASDAPEHVRHADLVRAWLERDELREELFDVLDAIGKGVSVTEIVWDVSGKQWLPARLEWRDPRWFEFSRADGRTPLLRTESGPQPLAPFKYIVHTHRSKSGLPIRGGLARPVAWFWLFKNMDIKGWVRLAEIFGVPLRLGRYGAGASEKDKATLLRAVRAITSDVGAIIPQGMMLEFPEVKLSGNVDLHHKLAIWIDQQISKGILGQTGTTDVGQHVGTADAHEAVRQDIETSDARQLSAALNRDLVRALIDLNFGPQRAYPRLRVYRPDAEDVTQLVTNVATLVPLGLKVGMSTMRDKLGLPDPDPDEELLGQQASSKSAPGTATAEEGPPVAHAAQVTPPEQQTDAIDQAVAEELADWQPLVRPLLDPVLALLQECLEAGADLEEFKRRLAELPARQDAGPMAEHLGGMMFKARGLGETGDPLDLV